MRDPAVGHLEDSEKEKGRAIMLKRLVIHGTVKKRQLDAAIRACGFSGEADFLQKAEGLPLELGNEKAKKPVRSMTDASERLRQDAVDKGAVLALDGLLLSGILTKEQAVREGKPFGIGDMADFRSCVNYAEKTENAGRDESRGKRDANREVMDAYKEGCREGAMLMLYRLAEDKEIPLDVAAGYAREYHIADAADFCRHAAASGYFVKRG